MNTPTFRILFLLASVALFAEGASAASNAPAVATPVSPQTSTHASNGSSPAPESVPMLRSFLQVGAKIYPLGKRGHLNGWFVAKDNQVQMVYTIDDDDTTLIVGVLFDTNNQAVSAFQMNNLYNTNPEVRNYMNSLKGANQQPPLPGQTQGQINPQGSGMRSAIMPAHPAPTAPAAGINPNAAASSPALASPGERLYQAMQLAAGADVGSPTAPRIMMIADPNCPHCQATWRLLRDSIIGNKLQVRLVPLGTENTDSERAAAQFLHTAVPLGAWDKYVGGDKSQLDGTPEPDLLAGVRANHKLIDSWHISVTPYIVYRAKDGQVKIVQGEIKDLPSMLADVGP